MKVKLLLACVEEMVITDFYFTNEADCSVNT